MGCPDGDSTTRERLPVKDEPSQYLISTVFQSWKLGFTRSSPDRRPPSVIADVQSIYRYIQRMYDA